MSLLHTSRLQSYFRETARRQHETVSCGPFTCFFHPSDPLPFFNYAIPDTPAARGFAEALGELRREFARRERLARFELVEGFAPVLEQLLPREGFALESRTCLMAVAPGERREPPRVADVSFVRVSASGTPGELLPILKVQREAFGLEDADTFGEDEASFWLRSLGDGLAVGARVGDAIVGAGFLQPSADNLAEVAGVAVLAPHRRRGIGAAITHELLLAGFGGGLSAVVLSAADEAAGRVYEGVGFRAVGACLAYREGPASS